MFGGATGFTGAGGGGGGSAYITSVTAPLVVTGGDLTIDAAGSNTCGVVSMATQAQTYAAAPYDAGGCPLVPSITHLIVRRQATQNAIFTKSNDVVTPNARGTSALDLQNLRTAATQVASGGQALCVGSQCSATGDHATAVGYACYAQASATAVGRLAESVVNASAFGIFAFAANGGFTSVGLGAVINSTGLAIDPTNGAISGTVATAPTGVCSTCVGVESRAIGAQSVSIGRGTFTNAYSSVSIGILNNQTGGTINASTGVITGTPLVQANGINSAAFGVGNRASALRSVAVGFQAQATGQDSVCVGVDGGVDVRATGAGSASFGVSAQATNTAALCISTNTNYNSVGSTASGTGAICIATHSNTVASNSAATASAARSIAIGTVVYTTRALTASGIGSVAIGTTETASHVASGYRSVSIGTSSTAGAINSVVVGNRCAVASGGTNSTIFGRYSFASATSVSAVSLGILCNQTGGTFTVATGAIGGAPVAGTVGVSSAAVGVACGAASTGSVAMGVKAVVSTTYGYCAAVGYDCVASGGAGVLKACAFGSNCTASASQSAAFGADNTASATRASAIGTNCTASANYSTALGCSAIAQHSSTICITGVSSAAYQLVIGGGSSVSIRNVYIGNGVTAASPQALSINPSGAAGTNVAGVNLYMAPGKGTGTAEPGVFAVKIPLKRATGATLQTLSSAFPISSVMFTQTATVTIINSAAEATLLGAGVGTLTVQGGLLRAGRTIRIKARGVYSTIAAAQGTIEFRIKLGAVTVCGSTAANLINSVVSGYWHIDVEICCRTVGATGTVFAQGVAEMSPGDGSGGMRAFDLENTATDTIDTTADNAIDVTSDFSVADNGNAISCTNVTIELLN